MKTVNNLPLRSPISISLLTIALLIIIPSTVRADQWSRSTANWNTIAPGTQEEFDISNPLNPITAVNIIMNSSATDAQLVVEVVNISASTPAPQGIVYRYIEFTPTNLQNFSTAVITFTLPASWLEKYNLSSRWVSLLHLENEKWIALETTIRLENAITITYQATTTGFSTFAIAAFPVEENETTNQTVATNTCGDGTCANEEQCDTCASDCGACPSAPEPTDVCTAGTEQCGENSIEQCVRNVWQTRQTCPYGCDGATVTCLDKQPTYSGILIGLLFVVTIVALIEGLLDRRHVRRLLAKILNRPYPEEGNTKPKKSRKTAAKKKQVTAKPAT